MQTETANTEVWVASGRILATYAALTTVLFQIAAWITRSAGLELGWLEASAQVAFAVFVLVLGVVMLWRIRR